MTKMLATTLFMLATMAWAAAQQPGSTPERSSGQATFPSTDKAGISYKLNSPPNADTSTLTPHVGESVQVAGNVKGTGKAGNASIDVQGIRRGTGKCPGSAQSPQKQ